MLVSKDASLRWRKIQTTSEQLLQKIGCFENFHQNAETSKFSLDRIYFAENLQIVTAV